MEPALDHRDLERRRWEYFQTIPPLDRGLLPHDSVKGSQVLEPLFEFSGACAGLRRDAVHQAGDPAVRRPHGRGQRHRVLIDLRRQPADDPVDRQQRRPGPRLEQLAVRGQRGVRARHASRPRPADRIGAGPPRAAGRSGRRRSGPSDPRQPAEDRGADRGPARRGLPAARPAGGDRRRGGTRRGPPPPPPRQLGPPERVDHRWRRLGLRHRLRRPRPRAVDRPRRQHPRAGHRGVLQHRRPGLEGDATGRGVQVRRRRQVEREEGPRGDRPRLRQRLRRPDLDGSERAAGDQGHRRGGRLAGPVVGDRLQHLHRPRHRHVQVDEPPEGRGEERLLAALPVPTHRGRGRPAVQAGLPRSLDTDPRLRRHRDRASPSSSGPNRSAPPAWPPSPRPTPTSGGGTTRSSPGCSAPSPTCPPSRYNPTWRTTPATATTRSPEMVDLATSYLGLPLRVAHRRLGVAAHP